MEYLHKIDSIFYINKPVENILYRKGSATHSPFRYRKQENEDWHQLMMCYPSNSEEDKKWLELLLVGGESFDLYVALLNGGTSEQIRSLRSKAKPYMHTYMKYQKVSMKQKFKLWCRMCMPIPLARCTENLFRAYSAIKSYIMNIICSVERTEIFPPDN